jgi:hypothetical protein
MDEPTRIARYEALIEQAFRATAHLCASTRVTVRFTPDETIEVTVYSPTLAPAEFVATICGEDEFLRFKAEQTFVAPVTVEVPIEAWDKLQAEDALLTPEI